MIDVDRALFRGRYGVAVARMEACGIPVSVQHLSRFQDNWQGLRMFYIRRDDEFGLYDGNGKFKEDRFTDLLKARGWHYGWPLTETGKLSMKAKDIGKQAARYPELKRLLILRESIAELKLSHLFNTIGADGRSRCPIMPFWNKTARNQPFGRDKIFLFALPSWLHGVAAPPDGYGMALLDFSCEEIGIAAGHSRDPKMIEDFEKGDPHMGYAIRTGLAPEGATKLSHKPIRKMVKPVSLGSQYGITKHGVAAQTGKSLVWAETALAIYRHTYPTFINWQRDIAAQAIFDERIESIFGWPMAVHAGTKTRTLLNFPAQSGGADVMQITAIAATEAGIQVCAPVHDAFWIMAPLAELDRTIETMKEIMLKAGRAVAGITIPVDVQYVVRWPQCLGDIREKDDKGFEMWAEVQGLIDGGELEIKEAAE